MRISPILYNLNSSKLRPKQQQSFGKNPDRYEYDHKILSMNNKEYIVAKTNESEKPLVIKPEIVDTFLRDEKGDIKKEYLSLFCTTYDEMIQRQRSHDFWVQDFYGGALQNILKDKENISQVGKNGNVVDFNFQQKQQEEKQKLLGLEAECKAVLEYEKQKPKNIEQDALEQTIIFMRMCKKPDGYTFHNGYEYNGYYSDRIQRADTLHFLCKKFGKDIATPLIKYATVDPKKSCDTLLYDHLKEFYHCNNFDDFSSIEQVTKFFIDTDKHRENHPWTIRLKMIDLSKHVSHKSPDFMFFMNKAVNKENMFFHKETIETIIEMFNTLNGLKDTTKADYSPAYNGQFDKKSKEIVKEYLSLYCDETTGEMVVERPDITSFCSKKIKN